MSENIKELITMFQDMAKNIPDNLTTIPAEQLEALRQKADKELQIQYYMAKYGNPDGTLDTGAMIKDWAKNGGEVYTYTNNGDGTFSFSEGYKYGNEDFYTGGFDVFSTGGNPYGGGIVYNEYGQVDWKNSTFSLFGGGGGEVDDPTQRRNKDLDDNSQVMMQINDK